MITLERDKKKFWVFKHSIERKLLHSNIIEFLRLVTISSIKQDLFWNFFEDIKKKILVTKLNLYFNSPKKSYFFKVFLFFPQWKISNIRRLKNNHLIRWCLIFNLITMKFKFHFFLIHAKIIFLINFSGLYVSQNITKFVQT